RRRARAEIIGSRHTSGFSRYLSIRTFCLSERFADQNALSLKTLSVSASSARTAAHGISRRLRRSVFGWFTRVAALHIRTVIAHVVFVSRVYGAFHAKLFARFNGRLLNPLDTHQVFLIG